MKINIKVFSQFTGSDGVILGLVVGQVVDQMHLQSWRLGVNCVFWADIVVLAPMEMGRAELVVPGEAGVAHLERVREGEDFVSGVSAINTHKVEGDGMT